MSPLVVWWLRDGKAGHDNQSRGLLQALKKFRKVRTLILNVPFHFESLAAFSVGKLSRAWRNLPAPDLLIGAGHRTHLPMLAARSCQQSSKIVVLMRPSLPICWFDLCLIPAHDMPPVHPNVLVTRGVLNHIQPSKVLKNNQGLILIGGISAHFGWDDVSLHHQIVSIFAATPGVQWKLATSRRTPERFLIQSISKLSEMITVVPFLETGSDWLPTQLAQAGQVWVTADSVSMVYEALTTGANVGILEVPPKRSNRISRSLEDLIAQGWVTSFNSWQRTLLLSRPTGLFYEAERCARWIIELWFR